ncbi:UPF0394 inner membrane protein YeeE isoform X2 [Aplysia californica]|nr:UPF0394 inner membrane protein YeeE isoform X2 [Aplysia californica]XP_012942681.1 UPF0394 inner membrane protein YeeE isoform X2 [Aplysia californica]XP_012942683.1 UPF0394 inner membrane protein YeeE isoform X2 [Aplysia californica]XP_012942685.1 UPF0394 inner membrane protein YeeE isoform X2 [Aplysia californica]XP_012942686.1 UPF0394 inner membrane protein YeeE isoform X2 [Aplysia californica]
MKTGSLTTMSSPEEKDVRYRFHWKDEGPDDTPEMPARSQEFNPVIKIATSIIMGVLFGLALEKGRVFEPQIIRQQMVLQNFTMMKMFVSASATGMLVFSFLTMIPATRRKMQRAVQEYMCGLRYKTIFGTGLGAAILGTGMTLAGACPGMVLAQVGAAVPHSVLTVTGGLLGVYLYALTDPVLPYSIYRKRAKQPSKLDEQMGTPYFNMALPLAALMGLFVFGLEVFFPWTTEVEQSGSGLFGLRSWPPFVVGMLIGSLQAPAVLILHDTLGSSSSYCTIASQALHIPPLERPLAYLSGFTSGMSNWWQVIFVGGAVVGAHLSAQASGTLHTVDGVGPMSALVGGLLMIFGARMASGCTSGHGLSGMGLLSLHSLVAVPAMFAGAIGTGCLMKYALEVDM